MYLLLSKVVRLLEVQSFSTVFSKFRPCQLCSFIFTIGGSKTIYFQESAIEIDSVTYHLEGKTANEIKAE